MEILEVKEILESLKQTSDVENAIELMKGFLDTFRIFTMSQISNSIKNTLEDFALENNRCINCNVELEVNEWKEERPYGDTYATETMSELKCPDCGKVY